MSSAYLSAVSIFTVGFRNRNLRVPAAYGLFFTGYAFYFRKSSFKSILKILFFNFFQKTVDNSISM